MHLSETHQSKDVHPECRNSGDKVPAVNAFSEIRHDGCRRCSHAPAKAIEDYAHKRGEDDRQDLIGRGSVANHSVGGTSGLLDHVCCKGEICSDGLHLHDLS